MTSGARTLLIVAAVAAGVGCSGNAVHLTPRPTSHPASSATPGPTPTATPTAGTASGETAKITTALQGVQTYYATLPHQNVNSDLAALAAQMVSSKAFATATVGLGGITATLPDGTPALVFADRLESLGEPLPAAVARYAASARAKPMDLPMSAPTQHEIALLVDELDIGPFKPQRQQDFATAFRNSGFATAGYGVDALEITLENIVALGTGHPIDYLTIDTHGFVSQPLPSGSASPSPSGTPFYANLSDTNIDDSSRGRYATDIAAGNVIAAIAVNGKGVGALPSWAFTPAFVTKYLTFNPGATVNNGSCWGANQQIFTNVGTTYMAAGVGRYNGWTKQVYGTDADQTDAFVFDRLLGEQSPSKTGLDVYASQRSPAQRPFGLNDVFSQLGSETRSGPMGTGFVPNGASEFYNTSDTGSAVNIAAPPVGVSSANFSIAISTSSANANDALVIPSIATMAVSEGTPVSTLTLTGYFSNAQGKVMDATSGGTTVSLDVESWGSDQVVVDLPPPSAGLGGMISVVSPTGVTGPAVPLTYWAGSFTYRESATTTTFGMYNGSGSGSLTIPMTIGIRADVAPTVPKIDTSPVPQNLFVSDVTPDSTASVSTYAGSFTSSDGTQQATITVANPAVALAPYAETNFIEISSKLNPVNAAAACNSAQPGPAASGQGNVACPGFYYEALNAATCSDNQSGALCGSADLYGSDIGHPSSEYGDDQDYDSMPSTLTFTMDPTTFAITVTSTQGTTYTGNFSDYAPTKSTMTGTFGAPILPPQTSALRRKAS